MKYIYWPTHLSHGINERAVVVALKGQETDWIVLSLIPELAFGHIAYPYFRIGIVDEFGNYTTELKGDLPIIEFRPPKLNMMQFFSIEPIPLILPEKDSDIANLNESSGVILSTFETTHCTAFRKSVSLINLYYKHEHSFRLQYPAYDGFAKQTIIKAAFVRSKEYFKSTLMYHFICHSIMYIVVSIQFVANGISGLLNCSIIPFVNLSATAQQIDLRCQQLCYFPVQYLRISKNISFNKMQPRHKIKGNLPANHKRRDSVSKIKEFPCEYYPDYIRLYNTLWLIVNDICFGLTIGTLLQENSKAIGRFLHNILEQYFYKLLHSITIFLGDNPFGIKLNGELAKFLSELFLWIIDFSYQTFIRDIISQENIEWLIKIFSCSSCMLGVTFTLSLIADMLSFLSMHISLFYFISAKIYHWQLHVMIALFHLFCGKKKNVLRNRIDANMFQLDQLLMGTLFFTILVFLFPTVSVFYVSYTLLWMVIVILEVILESLMASLNHFPLFALLLRLKDPSRIPGGVSVYAQKSPGKFVLNNSPLTVRRMFKPYIVLMGIMADTYFSSTTVRQVLVGKPIVVRRNRMYQVLYSALPRKPISAQDLWDTLKKAMA